MSTTDLDKPAASEKRVVGTQAGINPASPIFAGKMTLAVLAADLGKSEKTCRAVLHRLGVPIERIGNVPIIDIAQFRAAVERQATGTLAPPKRRRA